MAGVHRTWPATESPFDASRRSGRCQRASLGLYDPQCRTGPCQSSPFCDRGRCGFCRSHNRPDPPSRSPNAALAKSARESSSCLTPLFSSVKHGSHFILS